MQERLVETSDSEVALRDLNSDVYIPITVAMEDFQLYMEKAIPMNPEAVMGLVGSMFERPTLNKRPMARSRCRSATPTARCPRRKW